MRTCLPPTVCYLQASQVLPNRWNALRKIFITAFLVVFILTTACLRGAEVTAHWNAATDIPFTATSYTASGNSISLELDFSPSPATNLTVVKNTGNSPIEGAFDNLADGQTLQLHHLGRTYAFTANYTGGDGNDLVLHWANIRAVSWGANSLGQFGSGNTTSSPVPVGALRTGVLAGKTIVQIAVGEGHVIALCADGTLAAWGGNTYGQLGTGGTTHSSTPVSVLRAGVLANKKVVSIAAGSFHSLALCSDGTVASWGRNTNGILGNNTTMDSREPVAVLQTGVLAQKRVVRVSAGGSHCLALCSDGTLAAWGANSAGALGNNTQVNSSVPVLVQQSTEPLAGRTVVAIATGDSHSLVLCSDGTLAAWGSGIMGQLGAYSYSDSRVPIQVTQNTGILAGRRVVAVEAGGRHSLALCSDGVLAAWGENYDGQLGTNYHDSLSPFPVAVHRRTGFLAGKTIVGISASTLASVARCSDQTTFAWGSNSNGLLNLDTKVQEIPTPALLSTGALASAERFVDVEFRTAFAAALVAGPGLTDITVSGNSLIIADGDDLPSEADHTDMGACVTAEGAVVQTFTISNTSTSLVSLGSVQVTGAHSSDFKILSQPASELEIGMSTTFQIEFDPTRNGVRKATLSIVFNGFDDAPFTFDVQGKGLNTAPTDIVLTQPTIPENNAPSTTVSHLVLVDVDEVPGFVPAFDFVAGEGATDNHLFYILGSELHLIVSSNYETKASYSIRVGVSDADGSYLERALVVNVADDLELPHLGNPYAAGEGATHATFGGVVTFDGGSPILTHGVVYAPAAVNPLPSVGGTGVVNLEADGAAGPFSAMTGGLSHETTYVFRAYAINAQGIGYSRTGTFRTSLQVTFSAAGGAPLTAEHFVAGGTASFSLNHAPKVGASLLVINNTGREFISGTFSNLPHGHPLTFVHDEIVYHFVVSYFGGDGNDMVLQWARVTPMAWGRGAEGQLGTNGVYQMSDPVEVVKDGTLAGKTVVSMSAGASHSLATCSDGSVVAWGLNNHGRLGSESAANSLVPVAVVQSRGALAGKFVVAVAAGESHSLALCSDGALAAWGRNVDGELGNNTTATSSPQPTAVLQSRGALAGKNVIAIAAGSYHSLALCSDGTLAAWGDNRCGQLGNNSKTDSREPVAVRQTSGVLAGKEIVAITAGAYFSAALCSDGTVATWGLNSYGQLGNDSTSEKLVPTAIRQNSGVLQGKKVIAIRAGAEHCLALCSDGTLAAWGYPDDRLGTGGRISPNVPNRVLQSTGDLADRPIVTLASGKTHSLAQGADGISVAWGRSPDNVLRSIPKRLTDSYPAKWYNRPCILVASGPLARHSFHLSADVPFPSPVISGKGVTISSGDESPQAADLTDFGEVALNGSVKRHTFTIENTGDAPLQILGMPSLYTSYGEAGDFYISQAPASKIPARGSTSFTVVFDPRLPGLSRVTVSMRTNDPVFSNQRFVIQGYGRLTSPLAQTIVHRLPASIPLGDSPLQIHASATSLLPVALSLVSAPEGTTLDPTGLLTCTTPGSVKILATQPGNANYAPAPAVILSIQVKANPEQFTLTRLEQMYDGAPKSIGVEGASAQVDITYTVGGVMTDVAPVNAGVYPVKAVSGQVVKTAKLVIAKAPLFVTPVNQRRLAGQANPTLTARYQTWRESLEPSVLTKPCVFSTTAQPNSPAGLYPIRVSGGTALNYYLVYGVGSLTVDGFSGNYEALLVNTESLPVGKLSLTVPATAKTFTGKLQFAEELGVLPMTGTLDVGSENTLASGSASIKLKGTTSPYVVSVTLKLSGEMICSITKDSVSLAASERGRKLLELPAGAKVRHAGAHTVILEPATPAGPAIPGGAGWATASISTSGQITLTGRLADGTSFTNALAPDANVDPGYRLFIQPYLPARTQSYLGGEFHLLPHPDSLRPERRYAEAAVMTWRKAGAVKDPTCRAGFGPVTTVLTLDPWQAPTPKNPLPPLLGLASTQFGSSHGPLLDDAHAANLPTSVTLASGNVFKVLQPAANVTKWKGTLAPATGTFTGSFELLEGMSKVKRLVPFSGVLRQPPGLPAQTGTVLGDGHFVLPPLSGTEKTTGGVTLTPP